MEAVIQHFRAALNGFNRQDVQDYIEQLTAVHKQELYELQKRLEKAETRAAELDTQMNAMKGVAEEEAKAKASLEASTRMVTRLKGELSQSESKLSVAKKELERLQAQVNALGPMAASYQEIRDRAASVELEAHQRAQGAELEARHRAQEMVGAARAEADQVRSEARTEAERIRVETQSWLAKALEQYGQLRGDLDGMMEQARTVAGSAERLELLDESARRLREQGGLK